MNKFFKASCNLLLFLVFLVTSKGINAQQTFTHKFTSRGVDRWYGGAKPVFSLEPLRLVILFPGTTENLYEMLQRDYNSYIGNNSMVVYPESFNRMVGINGTDSIYNTPQLLDQKVSDAKLIF